MIKHDQDIRDRLETLLGGTTEKLGCELQRIGKRLYLRISDRDTETGILPAMRHLPCDRPERIDAILDETGRRLRRSHLRAATQTTHEPWTHDVHVLVHSVIRSCGGDAALLLPGDDAKLRQSALRLLIEREGVAIEATEWADGRIHVQALTIPKEGITVWDGADETGMLIQGLHLPQSIISGLPGRTLGEVLTHPMLREAEGVVITEVSDDPGGTILKLEDRREPVRRPPPGANEEWRRIAFR